MENELNESPKPINPDNSMKEFESSISKKAKGEPLTSENGAKLAKALDKFIKKLEEVEVRKVDLKPLPPVKPALKANAYKIAWDMQYAKLPDWRKREIDGFIKSGDTDNRFYTDFVNSIIETAEK